MAIPAEFLPVIQITLPLIGAMYIGVFVQNRHFDALGKRIDELRADMKEGFDKIDKRLDRIEKVLIEHGERIAKLEGPPFVRN